MYFNVYRELFLLNYSLLFFGTTKTIKTTLHTVTFSQYQSNNLIDARLFEHLHCVFIKIKTTEIDTNTYTTQLIGMPRCQAASKSHFSFNDDDANI